MIIYIIDFKRYLYFIIQKIYKRRKHFFLLYKYSKNYRIFINLFYMINFRGRYETSLF